MESTSSELLVVCAVVVVVVFFVLWLEYHIDVCMYGMRWEG